ncbi:MAG TPA: DUF4097 family beta strand repeat-containing protein [Bryobacteraceae bacterium]|nr:DUF4097 family beta strand repeat-containing protein [Bryobacteraceae bacterium]
MIRILALAVLLAAPGLADEWTKTFSISGAADLRVDTNDGAVTVRAWDLNRIEARVTTTGWKIGPGEVQVREHQTGDRVELDVHLPSRTWGAGSRTVRIELQVPRQTRSEIRTGDGRIRIEGVKGEAHLSTGDGAIEADTLDGTLEARTGDGGIRVRGRLDSLRLHTGDGSIQAEILAGSKIDTNWRVETGDGSVRLRLPSDFAADLDVHTGDGGISVDLPLTVSGVRNSSNLRGKLNNGTRPLYVRTNDGAIHIGRL